MYNMYIYIYREREKERYVIIANLRRFMWTPSSFPEASYRQLEILAQNSALTASSSTTVPWYVPSRFAASGEKGERWIAAPLFLFGVWGRQAQVDRSTQKVPLSNKT